MVSYDRKIANTILKLTGKDYSKEVFVSRDHPAMVLVHDASDPEISVSLPYAQEEILSAVKRLSDSGYLSSLEVKPDGLYFTIADKLCHRFAFAMDAFRKKFWTGFVVGLATGIAGTIITLLLTTPLQSLLQSVLP